MWGISNVFIGGINSYKSKDGGISFTMSSRHGDPAGINAGYIHVDVNVAKSIGNKIYCGSDGGLFINDFNENEWIDKTNGLGIHQIYNFGIDRNDPNYLAAGTQDNAASLMEGKTTNWTSIFGGDMGDVVIDWSDRNTMWALLYGNSVLRSTDGGKNYHKITIPDDLRYVSSFTENTLMQDYSNPNIIYRVTDVVHKSNDKGTTWTTISIPRTPRAPYYQIKSFDVCQSNNQVIAYTDYPNFYITRNGGSTWTSKNLYDMPFFKGGVRTMKINPNNPNHIAIGTTESVYFTNDGGVTWTDFKKNLPDLTMETMVWAKNANNGLYVGGLGFVMYIDDTMEEWIPFMDNLPNVAVTELEINYVANKIFASTYGRGMWASPLYGSEVEDEDVVIVDYFPPVPKESCLTAPEDFTPKVTIKNNGYSNLTSAVIDVKLNGSLHSTINFSGNLAYGEEQEVELNQLLGLGSGTYTLEIEVSQPNGVADIDNSNNTLIYEFEIGIGKQYQLNFVLDGKPLESSWGLRNSSNELIYSHDYREKKSKYNPVNETKMCLAEDCYELTVYDSKRNGISNGDNGHYEIVNLSSSFNVVETTDKNFGDSIKHEFCVLAEPYENDVTLMSVSGLTNDLCGFSDNAILKIANEGSANLTSYVVKVFVDGEEVKSITQSTNLPMYETEELEINGIPYSTSGNKTLEFVVSLPNGEIDNNTTLNSKTINQTVTIGDLSEFFISDRSYNSSLSWELSDGENIVLEDNKPSMTVVGSERVQEFCLARGCYDFVITNPFNSGDCDAQAFNASKTYSNGDQFQYNGKLYQVSAVSIWGTPPPDARFYWEVGPCIPFYNSDSYGIRKKDNDPHFEQTVLGRTSPASHSFCSTGDLTINFSANQTEPSQCESVIFNETITGGTPSSITWDFGEGALPSTAIGEGPHIVKYATTGLKTISVNTDGKIETKTSYINVSAGTVINPSVSINLATVTLCEEETTSFNYEINDEGVVTTFSWLVNNVEVSTDPNYSFTNLKNGDVVQLKIQTEDACGILKSAQSNEITMSLTPSVTPTISIAFAPGTDLPLCKDDNYIINATTTNAGSTGEITWFLNGIDQVNGSSYTFSGNNGDVIKATLASSETCVTNNNVTSNEITANVDDCLTTGTENTVFAGLKIYPNPTAQVLNVEMENMSRIRILDATGKMVDLVDNMSRQERAIFNLSYLAPGTYFVEVTTFDSQQKVQEIQVIK